MTLVLVTVAVVTLLTFTIPMRGNEHFSGGRTSGFMLVYDPHEG